MAADVWKIYNQFPEWMGDGSIDMDLDEFFMALFLSTSNCATLTLDEYSDLTNEHANAFGYTTGGIACTDVITNANQWLRAAGITEFDIDPTTVWTAAGGSIVARFAVIYDTTHATDALVCYSLLDNSPADVTATAGNTLTITVHADGVFRISD